MCVRLFCLSMCLTGHLLNPIALFVLFKERTRSFHFSTRGVCAGQMLCVSWWEGPTDHGGQTSTTEADLILSLLYVSKALFHPVLDCVVFCLATLIPRRSGQKCLDFCSWYCDEIYSPCTKPLRLVTGAWYSDLTKITMIFQEHMFYMGEGKIRLGLPFFKNDVCYWDKTDMSPENERTKKEKGGFFLLIKSHTDFFITPDFILILMSNGLDWP